jgi:type I restriction enzyme, S subunit
MTMVELRAVIGQTGLMIDGDWVESKDQDPNGEVRLTQLADIGVGAFLDKSARYMNAATARRLNCTFLQKNDILVARMPDPIGRACVFPGSHQPCVTAVDVCIIRPDRDRADARYLNWMINSREFQGNLSRHIKGSTRQRISRRNLEVVTLPLPPLVEQRMIAAILDEVDGLRLKRRKTLEVLDELSETIFIYMFIQNEGHDWPIQRVTDFASDVRTGPFGSQLLHSEFVDEGVAVLGIDNAVNNEFQWDERRFITPEKYRSLQRYTVRPGDVLITLMGTCGRCAVVPDDIPTAINTKHLCCITVNRTKVLPEFLHASFLQHPNILKQLGVQAKGAVMPGLNMGIIKCLELRLPPLDVQRAFVSRIKVLNEVRANCGVHKDHLDRLFASLQHLAFRGELTSKNAQRELAMVGE